MIVVVVFSFIKQLSDATDILIFYVYFQTCNRLHSDGYEQND